MDHHDHVSLLAGTVSRGETWADLGAGRGAFTLALADLVGPSGTVVAVDRDGPALRANRQRLRSGFPDVQNLHLLGDIRAPLPLKALDGVVLSNVLHFQADQEAVVRLTLGYLAEGGAIAVVEYNIERPNPAVPVPVPFTRWRTLAGRAGAAKTALLHRRPSRWHREIYSAVSRW